MYWPEISACLGSGLAVWPRHTVGMDREEPEGCASKSPIPSPRSLGVASGGSDGRSLRAGPALPPVAALALGTTLQVLCLLLHFRELRVDLACSSPTEQEKEEDRFHSLQRFRADLAAQGKPG